MLEFPLINDTSRKIIHIDMDAFFAQVEMRDDPSLKDKPVIIGHDPRKTGGRGVSVRYAAPAPSKVPSCNPKSSLCARSAWSDRIHAGLAAVQGHLRESHGSHRGRFLSRHA